MASSNDARITQELIRVEGSNGANAFAELRDQIVACLPDRAADQLPQRVDDLTLLGVGDQAWMGRYYLDPSDPIATTVVIGLVDLAVTDHRDITGQ